MYAEMKAKLFRVFELRYAGYHRDVVQNDNTTSGRGKGVLLKLVSWWNTRVEVESGFFVSVS